MITVNLLFWIPWLVICAITMRLFPTLRERLYPLVELIYRAAVTVDTFWLRKVLGIRFNVTGRFQAERTDKLIVLCNHQSWFDILVLQGIITSNGPILQFLIKRELIYVPVVGWICLALNFPRLHRNKQSHTRHQDYESVTRATMEISQTPGALVNFAEGTRFTRKKHAMQNSPYQHLLKPRVGGFNIMLDNLPSIPVLDVTLKYPHLSFWRCLSGELKSVDIHLQQFDRQSLQDPTEWLTTLWHEKDQRLNG